MIDRREQAAGDEDPRFGNRVAFGVERAELLAAAKAEYRESSKYYLVLILKYCVEEADAAAMKYTLLSASDKKLPELEQLAATDYSAVPNWGTVKAAAEWAILEVHGRLEAQANL